MPDKWKAITLEINEDDMAFVREVLANISGPPENWRRASCIIRLIDEAPRQEYTEG